MKIVYNAEVGGFALSRAAYEHMIAAGVPVCAPGEDNAFVADDGELHPMITDDGLVSGMVVSDNPDDAEHADAWIHQDFRYWDTYFALPALRSHAALVSAVETLGDAASGPGASLRVVEYPDGAFYLGVHRGRETVFLAR